MESSINVFEAARRMVSRGWIEAMFHAPGAHWEGENFLTLNPVRPDRGIKSFSIREDGKWYDFAGAEGERHGDVFDLLAVIEGRTAIEVAKDLIGGQDAPPPRQVRQEESRASIKPDWQPIPEGRTPKFNEPPSCLTLYHDYDGQALFFVARWEPNGAARPKKEIKPIYWDGAGFRAGLPPSLETRPLYLFDATKTVIIVEGEKKRAVLEAAVPEYSVTCWHGGASAAKKVDLSIFEALSGAEVILWPDADQVGLEAMDGIAGRLSGYGLKVRVVEIPEGVAKGWDAADAVVEGVNVRTLLQLAPEWKPKEDPAPQAPVNAPTKAYNFTDLGNAERFVDLYRGVIHYNVDRSTWAHWTGESWDSSDSSRISPCIKGALATIPDGSAAAAAYQQKCESNGAIKAMLSLASTEPGIPVRETDFDPDPFLFSCASGVIDLRTGEVQAPRPEMLISKRSPVRYNPKAECPNFHAFLKDITLDRCDIAEFFRRWFGYSMTADTSAQSFAIFHGNGANGKSTLVELIARIMGTYGRMAPPDTFVQKPTGGIPNDIAALRGSRMVLTTETEANAKLAESRVKSMTGGDRMSARYLHGEFFEFSPTWKIIISTNHRPRISGADYGIWRRIVLVPFDFMATPEKADPRLPEKLWAEREGILSWMVSGAVDWYKDGMGREALHISSGLCDATQDYREDEDIIGRFIAEECWKQGEGQFDISGFKIAAAELHKAFTDWASREGEIFAAKMTANSFGRALRERGYEKVKNSSGRMSYVGIIPKSMSEGV